MVLRTVGVGGDHANLHDAWAYLLSVDPLTDIYHFKQISDFTEPGDTAGDGIQSTAGAVNLNNSTVRFYCEDGYTITMGGTYCNYFFYFGSSNGTLQVDGLKLQFSKSSTSLERTWIFYSSFGVNGIAKYNNITIFGYNQTTPNRDGIGFSTADNRRAYISNCIIYKCANGVTQGGGIGTVPSYTYYIIENCTMYKCLYGVSFSNPLLGTEITVRNTVANGSTTKDFNTYNNGERTQFYNCADSDNSLASMTQKFNCITGITDSDFLSVDKTSKHYLRIGRISDLFQTGMNPSIAANIADIDGNVRPNWNGKVSIGVSEPLPYDRNVVITCCDA